MKIIQKITAVFLATVFLFSSLGFTISSMVCLKSGKGEVAFAAMVEDCCSNTNSSIPKTDCCHEEAELDLPKGFAVIKEGECCDINNYSFQLNEFQNPQKLSLEQPIALNSFFYTSEKVASSSLENKLTFQYSDLPPPLYGRTLLNFISILTI